MTQPHAAPRSSNATTPASLRALLAGIIDYAGLFPPAGLPLPDVVRRYSEYVQCDESWMLGRLIMPASKLDEFETEAVSLLPTSDDSEPWRLSALIRSAVVDDLGPAVERIVTFNAQHSDAARGKAVVETIEVRADSAEQIDAALDGIPDELFPFFEIASDADPRGMISALAGSEAGAKIRTGGVTPDLYPSPEDVARFVLHCASANVPFKATAGLHHPLRYRNTTVGAEEFGFLNVFIGGCMAAAYDLDDDTLLVLLTEQSAAPFEFTDEHIKWHDITLPVRMISDCRDTFAISFGSCSFDEPREDLRDLGLMVAGS